MRFTCERCGKRYATAETPAPGRVYKIRCKACGHLIVVKGSAASSSPPAPAISPPSPGAVRPTAAAPSRPGPRPPEPAPEPTPARLAAARQLPDPPPPPPPPAEAAFVDLFADLGSVGDLTAPPAGELRTPPPEPLPQPAAPRPATHLVPQPAQQKRGRGPVVLIALGALVLVGILAFVLLGGGGAAPPVAAPKVELQAPPAPPAPPPRVARPDPSAPAGAAAAAPPAKSSKRASDDRRTRSRERIEREPERPARGGATGPKGGEREIAGEDDAPQGPPTEARIRAVIAASRQGFQDCLGASARSGDPALDGRRVTLRLYVLPNGGVSYPFIDDPDINGTDLGACLKSSARMMTFPKFSGRAISVDVPLVLAAGR